MASPASIHPAMAEGDENWVFCALAQYGLESALESRSPRRASQIQWTLFEKTYTKWDGSRQFRRTGSSTSSDANSRLSARPYDYFWPESNEAGSVIPQRVGDPHSSWRDSETWESKSFKRLPPTVGPYRRGNQTRAKTTAPPLTATAQSFGLVVHPLQVTRWD